jgi:glycosyltransferase involved in cell wall biosynthesis
VTRVVRVITRLNIGGPAQHVVHLTALLPDLGFDSVLVSGRVDADEGDMSAFALRRGVVPYLVPALRNSASPVDDLRACLALYRLFRRQRPHIVHLHLLKARVLGGMAARLARVPLVVETFHGTLFRGYYRGGLTRLLIALERAVARWMDGVVAVSPAVKDELVGHRVVAPEKVTVIPLGLDLGRLVRPDLPRGLFRAELGVGPDVPLVGAVGRLVPVKGLDTLLEAAALVARRQPRAVFVLVGDGPQRPVLVARTRALALDGQVRFVGWRMDVEHIYPDLDVVVLPSLHEGTPVSVIEAMAAGRPVVATSVGGVPDLIRDRDTGLLVPPRDPGALAAAILELLEDPALRARLGAAARPAVYPGFDVSRLASDTAAYYRRLLARGGRGVEGGG